MTTRWGIMQNDKKVGAAAEKLEVCSLQAKPKVSKSANRKARTEKKKLADKKKMQAIEEMLGELDADPVWGPVGQQPKQEPEAAHESAQEPAPESAEAETKEPMDET